MRAQSWAFGAGLPVGMFPLGVLGDSPGAGRCVTAVLLTLIAGWSIAGLFDDGSVDRATLAVPAIVGVAILPVVLTLLFDWG